MVRWLDEQEMRAWRGLRTTFDEVLAALDADLVRQHGIAEGDYGVLVALSEAPEHEMRMCDLAANLHLSPSGLTRRLDGLVRQGYVERRPSPCDRRVALAFLTEKGRTKLEAAAPDHVESVRRYFLDHLTPAQITEIGAAFSAIAATRHA
jgi:DNA-binding MarR family transcriptional regulator